MFSMLLTCDVEKNCIYYGHLTKLLTVYHPFWHQLFLDFYEKQTHGEENDLKAMAEPYFSSLGSRVNDAH